MHAAYAGGHAGDVLALVTEALDVVAAGKDPRPLVCAALARLLEADAAGFAVRDHGSSSEVILGEPTTLVGFPHRVLLLAALRDASDQPAVRWAQTAPEVHDRIAWLPVPPAGGGAALHMFARAAGFRQDAIVLLRCAQQPMAAVERVYRRSLSTPFSMSPTPAPTPPADGHSAPRADLTAREREVLQLLSEGLLARTIAARLAVSPRTVHHHLGSIYDKLGVRDRLSAVLRARALGLLGGATSGSRGISSATVPVS